MENWANNKVNILTHFEQYGFAIVPEFIDELLMNQMRNWASDVVSQCSFQDLALFTTNEQARQTTSYFIKSAYQVSCFLEEEAIDEYGQLRLPISLAINKIGHAFHDLVPLFRDFVYSGEIGELVEMFGFIDPFCAQSMYIFKQPRIGGAVRQHCDSTFLQTTPSRCLALWIALDDARIDNGCLWVAPEKHLLSSDYRFVRKHFQGDDCVEMEFEGTPRLFPEEDFQPLELKAGSLVLMHGDLPHFSHENRSQLSRQALTLHVCEAHQSLWSDRNWLQRPKQLPFRNLLRPSL